MNKQNNQEPLVFSKPESMQETHTHYCPGCMHGIIHRLVAESLDELDLRRRACGVAPVGCSVLIYNYLNTDFLEAPHGRAPALATGLKRVRPDMIVYTYQGDGDLASIGTNEIIHAANRGEKFTTIFVNNTVYGMTGGQMAPTTLPGQRTTTSPAGRDVTQAGYPLRVAEMLATSVTPGYIARVSVHDVPHIIKAKRAIKRAFQYQQEDKCFSLIEVISNCPTNWGMTPKDSINFIKDKILSFYKLGEFKTPAAKEQGE